MRGLIVSSTLLILAGCATQTAPTKIDVASSDLELLPFSLPVAEVAEGTAYEQKQIVPAKAVERIYTQDKREEITNLIAQAEPLELGLPIDLAELVEQAEFIELDMSAEQIATITEKGPAISISSCDQGKYSFNRSFILCSSATADISLQENALYREPDQSLDLITVAGNLGLPKNEVIGIAATTYSRIVGKTDEVPDEESIFSAENLEPVATKIVEINGREFEEFTVQVEGKSALLLVER